MFVQIIEGTAKDPDALIAAGDAWQAEVRPGAIGYLGVTAGVTPDRKAFTIVRFEDEASARANSDRPEQGAWFEKHLASAYEAPPTFTESSDVIEFSVSGDIGIWMYLRGELSNAHCQAPVSPATTTSWPWACMAVPRSTMYFDSPPASAPRVR